MDYVNIPKNPTVDELNEIVTKLAIQETMTTLIGTNTLAFIVGDNGNVWDAYYWASTLFREAWTQQHDENFMKDLNYLNEDLVRISYHADCSPLCLPYQTNIYSVSGTSNEYPPFDEILWNYSRATKTNYGGGYRHPNCRHFHSIYIEGMSFDDIYDDRIPDKEVLSNYNARENRKKDERLAKKWGDKAEYYREAGLDDHYTEARSKRIYYNKRAKSY